MGLIFESVGGALARDEILRLINEGRLVVEPFDECIVRENGLDLRFGNEFAILDYRCEEELKVIEDIAYGRCLEKVGNRWFYVWRRGGCGGGVEEGRWYWTSTIVEYDFEVRGDVREALKRGESVTKVVGLKLPVLNVHDFEPSVEYRVFKNVEYIVAPPKSSILVTTLEYVKFPDDVMGLCGVRSTFARLGIFVPLTAVDCGFEGQLTIELINTTNKFIIVKPGTRFLHVILLKTIGKAEYKGKYQGQRGVTVPKPIKE